LGFYTKSARETFASFVDKPIDFKIEEPYAPLNPSIWFDGERWRCLVRTVNYRLNDGQYYGPGGKSIHTRNFMVELTPNLETVRSVEMYDRDPTPRTDFPVHGFEDCRLFTFENRLQATCTVCDFTHHGQREIALLHIDPDDYSIRRAQPLRGPWSGHHQKNWMPLVNRESVRFVYATYPEVVFELKADSVDTRGATNFNSGELRGGSQGVHTSAGWLFVIHTVTANGTARTYLHRFVLMSDDFKVVGMTAPFHFVHRGIEFCAGLALDGQRLIASFGIEDREVRFGIFNLHDVLVAMRHDFGI
jgi:hypothetical protein